MREPVHVWPIVGASLPAYIELSAQIGEEFGGSEAARVLLHLLYEFHEFGAAIARRQLPATLWVAEHRDQGVPKRRAVHFCGGFREARQIFRLEAPPRRGHHARQSDAVSRRRDQAEGGGQNSEQK